VGQSGRPSYPGGLTTPTSLGNVGSNSHSSADLRVGTAVALASSVAKYWVLTNLFPGPIPQVSVYHPHHRAGAGGGETSTTKDSAALLNQDMSLTSGAHHQTPTTSHHHQPSINRSSHHSSLQTTAQVCQSSVHVI
jgi:KRAB domain-containing zinc finger protein